jgi:serine/threonine protein kinase
VWPSELQPSRRKAPDDREVAVKILPETVAENPESLARFMAMELVPGSDLSQRISKRALFTRDALAFAVQIAEALEAAHGQGIIHRDITPQNLMVTPDGTRIVFDRLRSNADIVMIDLADN